MIIDIAILLAVCSASYLTWLKITTDTRVKSNKQLEALISERYLETHDRIGQNHEELTTKMASLETKLDSSILMRSQARGQR